MTAADIFYWEKQLSVNIIGVHIGADLFDAASVCVKGIRLSGIVKRNGYTVFIEYVEQNVAVAVAADDPIGSAAAGVFVIIFGNGRELCVFDDRKQLSGDFIGHIERGFLHAARMNDSRLYGRYKAVPAVEIFLCPLDTSMCFHLWMIEFKTVKVSALYIRYFGRGKAPYI